MSRWKLRRGTLKEIRKIQNMESKFGLGFILPSVIGQCVFFLFPMMIIFYYSMIKNPMNKTFVGLNNYISIWHNEMFLRAMKNTFAFIGISISLIMVLSLLLAMILNKPLFLRNIFRICFMIPLIVPSVSVLMVWDLLFNFNGALNNAVTALGLTPVDWMNSKYSRILVIIFFIWKNIGYNMVLFLAALQSIPKEQYEAASIDGANKWLMFKHITLINILPTTFFIFIISITNSFRIFREIFLISGEYPQEDIYMIQHYINNLFNVMDYQKLSVSAIYLMFFIFMLVVLWRVLEKKLEE